MLFRSKSSIGLTRTENELGRFATSAINKINESIKKDFVEKMRLVDNEINDHCFVMNFPSLLSQPDKQ